MNSCTVKTSQINTLWDILLSVKRHALKEDFDMLVIFPEHTPCQLTANNRDATFYEDRRIILSNTNLQGLKGPHLQVVLDASLEIAGFYNHLLSHSDAEFFRSYLPYALLPVKARQQKKTLAISHFAQSLDGKIATHTGHSKWISNRENLIHAHRMRALCDGILIGGNTLNRDHPRLTVRHVRGADPVKIILGGSAVDFSSVLENGGQVIWLTGSRAPETLDQEMTAFQLKTRDGLIPPLRVLNKLYELGIHSIYIEGGAFTTSYFLFTDALEEIQVYISPEIIGSGLPSFSLPGISKIDHAIQFTRYQFIPMGNGLLFTGKAKHSKHGKKRTMARFSK